jgi:hypothetical protein
MRSELIMKAIARPTYQGCRTMQRLRMAGVNAGECGTMTAIQRVGQALCLADGDRVGPAMDILAAQLEKRLRSLRRGLGSRESSRRQARAHPQSLRAAISCTPSPGTGGRLNITGNMPLMQDGRVPRL